MELQEHEILKLYEECSVTGLSSGLSKEEKEYFWLQTRILGWKIDDPVTKETVYDLYKETLKKHKKILEVIEKTDRKLLLHHLQADLSVEELEDVLLHIYNK
ncbi:hypothetical protein NEIG_01313 [Nematocida sp. ERTm5]|nr:hypothetical protein NEIRO02_0994 [Nematocida sp. AWRm79]KAI5183398.1 hypothetical protein NEIRO03_0995 [Nematocida sp. AWRm78]OAG32075.1 hypothetical protein NEIG_01313 [Nematocida sp. ERTm5]